MQKPSSGRFDAEQVPDPMPARLRGRSVAAVAAAVLVSGALALAWLMAPPRGGPAPDVAMLEEAIVLRCLSPGDAAELVKPHLRLRSNSVVYAPARAPHALTVRGTPAQLEHVKAVLDGYEGAGSPACAPTATAT